MSNDETFLRRWSRRKHESAQAADAEEEPVESAVPPQLPPVEDLSFASDFKDFMRPEVDRETRSAALKKLFMSPHYRATDGLDVYVGDYSSPEPLPAAMLAGLVHARGLLADDKPDAPIEPATLKTAVPETEASAAQAAEPAAEAQQTDPTDASAGPADQS